MSFIIAQIDGGYTLEGFTVNLLIAAVSAILGVVGALLVANHTLEKTAKQAEQERREARESATVERRIVEHGERVRALRAVEIEIEHNLHAIKAHVAPLGPSIPLRSERLEQVVPHLIGVPASVAESLQRALYEIDRCRAFGSLDSSTKALVCRKTAEALQSAQTELYDLLGERSEGST